MELLPLSDLGPREVSPRLVRFGLLLPGIRAADGYRLKLKIIHETDQFLRQVAPREFELAQATHPNYPGEYWSTELTIDPAGRPHASSAWGREGTYVYRYQLEAPGLTLDWIVDPFAREFGLGKLAAFTLGYRDHTFSAAESAYRTPALSQLIVYELMLHEFQGGNLAGAAERLGYLRDLGVNCVEVMPISNVEAAINWGFEPIGYFGVDERFGNRRDFQNFVDRAHQHGIAVILDVVYGHTGVHFPYEYIYSRLGPIENPFMGAFGETDMFGPSTDWRRKFVQDYFYTVNRFWIDTCHVDGFRYDCVPNYWDGATGVGYANLVYQTYRSLEHEAKAGSDPYLQRFVSDGDFHLIQCAEQLQRPIEVVETTYSHATWQNETLAAASAVASGDRGKLYELGMSLTLHGYPDRVAHPEHNLPKSAFQYLENHDHPRFLTRFGTTSPGDEPFPGLFARGDRSRWYKLQPYLIGLFTCRGIPLLWQGQELAADNVIAERGLARIGITRPVPWEYFYDEYGQHTVQLVRRLIELRRANAEFCEGASYFYNDWERYQSRGALLYSRSLHGRFTLVALNFSDDDVRVPFTFARTGLARERLHGEDNLAVTQGREVELALPSNYGRVWSLG